MKRIIFIAVGVAAAIALLFAYNRDATPASIAAAPDPIPVTIGTAKTQDLPVWRVGVGAVQALATVDVRARVDGQLVRVVFREGSDVRAGDLLAQIDPRPYQAEFDAARAGLAKDEASLANAKVNLARYEKLVAAGAAPSQNVDTLRAQVAELEATRGGDRATIETARLNLEFTALRSPLDGRAGLRRVDPGAIVHASDPTGLVTVTQVQPIAVLFSLPEDVLPDVVAARAKGDVMVVARSRDGGATLAPGTLAAIDDQIDPTTGQIRMKAQFANADRALWPGELVSVRVLVKTDRGATVVPSTAVLQGQDGAYVYAVKPDSSVEVRAVQVGESVDGLTAITKGVAPNDTIVVGGQARLTPGAKVRS